MSERKILLFALTVVIYCLYSATIWFTTPADEEKEAENSTNAPNGALNADFVEGKKYTQEPEKKPRDKKKRIPLYFKNACSVLEVFLTKPPPVQRKKNKQAMDADDNQLAVIGITVLLIALAINAILDVLKVKEEERLRLKNNPEGERRQSLAEFANKKTLRRESSKIGQQLFQIAESFMNQEEEKKEKPVRPTRIYKRGESTNSYLSEKNFLVSEGSSPKSAETPTGDTRNVKRHTASKIFGARPAPMVRRSSFPALPLNPDIQALMLGNRRPSTTDSDDEDGKGRRVRIIRRY